MKLYLSTTSPYARLTAIVALRAGHHDIALEFVLPWQNPKKLTDINPFSQVPALLCDDGTLLTDSLIICQYLDNRFIQGGHDSTLISYGIATINQAVRYISLNNMAPHPMMQRSLAILANTLPKAPTLQPNSNNWGQILLGNSLNYIRMRLPKLYQDHVSPENKIAIPIFLQRDFMIKTEQSTFEKYPSYIREL